MDEESATEIAAYLAEHGRSLRRLAFALTGRISEADDLLQDTLVKALSSWPKIAKADHPTAHVRIVMVNTARSRWRRTWRQREVLVREVPEIGLVDISEAAVDDRRMMAAALRRLPPKQRSIVVLRYHEDLPEAEVAKILRCSVGNVKSQAARGLSKLRLNLSEAERGARPAFSPSTDRSGKDGQR